MSVDRNPFGVGGPRDTNAMLPPGIPGAGLRCPCCGMQRIPRWEARRKFCAQCEVHQGQTGSVISKRDREHVKDWAEFHAKSVANARASSEAIRQKIRELEEYITQLRAERDEAIYAFENSIVTPDAVAMLETERVRQADERADSAYRSRDRLASALWRLRMMHNDDKGAGTCSCGEATADCTIREILEAQMNFLEYWEEKQTDRLRADKDHALPDEHPMVIRYGRYSRRY